MLARLLVQTDLFSVAPRVQVYKSLCHISLKQARQKAVSQVTFGKVDVLYERPNSLATKQEAGIWGYGEEVLPS